MRTNQGAFCDEKIVNEPNLSEVHDVGVETWIFPCTLAQTWIINVYYLINNVWQMTYGVDVMGIYFKL